MKGIYRMLKQRKSPKSEAVILILIFVVMLITRLYHIDSAPLEMAESWRQADTESIARNFAEYKFNILYPNFNYDGPLPNIPALEFQVTTFAIAILYKLFGFNYLWARLIPLCFFFFSAIFLYAFSKKYLGRIGGLFSLVAYAAIPINVYYSRAIMPEAAGLMFFIGGLYYFDYWLPSKKLSAFIAASVLTALALMTKPVTIFIAIPMLYLCIREHKWECLVKKEFWAYALLTLGLAITYYCVSIPLADYKFSQDLAQNVLFRRLPTAILDPSAYIFLYENLIRLLTPVGIALGLIGLFSLKKNQLIIFIWFIAMVLELLLVVTVIRAYYYLIFFAVPCCMLIGQGLSYLYSRVQSRIFSVILLMFLILNSFMIVRPMYTINTAMQTQVKLVEQFTSKEDLLVVGSIDPCLLGISGRKGWRFNLDMYPDIPRNAYEELNYYIKNGGKYFVPIQGKIFKDKNGEILEYLDKNYEKIEAIKGYPIYKLQ